ncbi:MAG: ATP-binding protein [Opitutales bacterium]|nr:ATP-binding protein [Opitutales bacterium]
MKSTFKIENKIEVLADFAEAFQREVEPWNLPPALQMNLDLVLEEVLSNIIHYGFSDQQLHWIEIHAVYENGTVMLRISDDGVPFDPTEKAAPDLTQSIEDRPVGGLGIFLVRKLMDQVTYLRENDHNILILEKTISS